MVTLFLEVVAAVQVPATDLALASPASYPSETVGSSREARNLSHCYVANPLVFCDP